MSDPLASPPSMFSRTLRECRDLYLSSGQLCETEHPELLDRREGQFVQLMDDLHQALVLKVDLTICEADREWTKDERFLAEVMGHHLWDQWLSGDALRSTMKKASADSQRLAWSSIVRPFATLAPLRDKVGQLETIVMRLANVVARADGRLKPEETAAIQSIQREIDANLKHVAADTYRDHDEADTRGAEAIEKMRQEASKIYIEPAAKPKAEAKQEAAKPQAALKPTEPAAKPPTVEESLAELDKLIGLTDIKEEVRSLANFLKLQQKRREANLPETDVNLHMVFTGNPGTGKTTVARIVGKIYQALGVLDKGHLIETDRSGLVAEYAGQTGPKTQKKVDEALDGILFIDEAYSLVASDSEDPYGHEAIQALLKRAEDDRARLVVILAGYPVEMRQLLHSNPGLSSRFNRQLDFDDYTPVELAKIFELMCDKNHYKLSAAVRWCVLYGMTWQYERRDRHFGNGRAARNLFEQAIRRLANRLATDAEITTDDLQQLMAGDIDFRDTPLLVVPPLEDAASRVLLMCPKCVHQKEAPAKYLGESIKCPKCSEKFVAAWGDVVPPKVESAEQPAESTAESPAAE